MNISEDDRKVLMDLLGRLKPSDMSILQAALETPDSQIGTVKNSPNDIVWSKMEELGLAREMTLELELPPEARNFQPKSFALTELGRMLIPELLERVKRGT